MEWETLLTVIVVLLGLIFLIKRHYSCPNCGCFNSIEDDYERGPVKQVSASAEVRVSWYTPLRVCIKCGWIKAGETVRCTDRRT